jgi:hypothetical protein
MQRLSRVALATLLTIGLSGVAVAGNPPSTGLGQAWPNAADVSASPNWHVYVFVLNGVKYVQVNDLNGNVLGAIGTAGGQYITLPIGRFSQYVSTPQQPAAMHANAMPAAPATTVYEDNSTKMFITPQNDGTLTLFATKTDSTCDDPRNCAQEARTP